LTDPSPRGGCRDCSRHPGQHRHLKAVPSAARFVAAVGSDGTHTIGEGPFTSLAQTAAWISRRAETKRQHGLLWYAVRDRGGGRILGNCGLFAGRTGSAEPEIGYEIRRSCQGRGLATEAARAVLDDALASGISRVWATIRPHNTASLRVAAKIGMTLRHTRPDSRGPLAYLARP
jgi:ribosomal-protein-alanine N-acetyltransferase